MTNENKEIAEKTNIKTGLIILDIMLEVYPIWIKESEKMFKSLDENTTLWNYFEGQLRAEKIAYDSLIEIKEDFILFCQKMEEDE